MLAVSTDQIIPNSVGDLALKQWGIEMSVFLDGSTKALSKIHNLFLPQKLGSNGELEVHPLLFIHLQGKSELR